MAAEDSAEELVSAIHSGDVVTVVRLLQERPELLSGPLGRGFGTRTVLVAATDWPGYFPNGPEIVRILIAAGADPDGVLPATRHRCTGPPAATTPKWRLLSSTEGPTSRYRTAPSGPHWTTPSATRVGMWPDCWSSGVLEWTSCGTPPPWDCCQDWRNLAETQPPPEPEAISQAFWHACAGGQRRAAEYLLGRGADLNWVPDYARGTPLDAANGLGTRQENVISWLRDLGARSEDSE